MKARRILLAAVAGLLGLGSAPVSWALLVAKDGRAMARIIVPEHPSNHLRGIAKTLQHYVKLGTGAELPILEDQGENHGIHLGATRYARELAKGHLPTDEDGFQLIGDRDDFAILGGSDWGTEFGTYESLENYLGIRWLMPTAMGEDVPVVTTLELPAVRIEDAPSYVSRQLSPLDIDNSGLNRAGRGSDPGFRDPHPPNQPNGIWGRFNRARGRVAFHHNLLTLYPPIKYVTERPDFYPLIAGARRLPLNDPAANVNWQPNFSAPGIAAEGAKAILEYFRTHPEAPSYSLGMNDTTAFDESAASKARRSGKLNYLQEEDVFDDYFTWANEVVTAVTKEFPEKWFGTLAYHNIGDPPTHTAIHPHIIPFLTYERMRWVDPELAQVGKRQTELWLKASPNVGWYDYAWGCQYLVPRVWFHEMQDYLRWGAEHGVRFNYAELYPNWGEGPKAWIYCKLLWNPKQDVDGLLKDWYEHAVGTKAALKLAEFYRGWEQFWTVDIMHSKWNTRSRQYLSFNDLGYLLLVPDELIARSDRLVQETVELADTPARKRRSEELRNLWRFYKSSVLAYRSHLELVKAEARSVAEEVRLLDHVAAAAPLSEERQALLDAFGHSELNWLLQHSLKDNTALAGRFWGLQPIWIAGGEASGNPALREQLEKMSRSQSKTLAWNANAVSSVSSADWRSTGIGGVDESERRRWLVEGQWREGVPNRMLFSGPQSVTLSRNIHRHPGTRVVLLKLRASGGDSVVKVTVAINALNADTRIISRYNAMFPGASLSVRSGEEVACAIPFTEPSMSELSQISVTIKAPNFPFGTELEVENFGFVELDVLTSTQ